VTAFIVLLEVIYLKTFIWRDVTLVGGIIVGLLVAWATHRLNENLIEVYPKATLTQLFTARTTRGYKRSAGSPQTRLDMLNALGDLTFAPGAWRQHALDNDHKFDAVICAYTAYLWSRGACLEPTDQIVRDDGWIYFPAKTP